MESKNDHFNEWNTSFGPAFDEGFSPFIEEVAAHDTIPEGEDENEWSWVDQSKAANVPLAASSKEIKTTVFDVAAYIVEKLGKVSTIKLQKLVYYCQAWSLVWEDEPLFTERIEAWVNGPVVKDLFAYHRGFFEITSIAIGNPDKLSLTQKETIEKVIDYYGPKSTSWLVELSHHEQPWILARKGISPTERGNREITLASMGEYYSSL